MLSIKECSRPNMASPQFGERHLTLRQQRGSEDWPGGRLPCCHMRNKVVEFPHSLSLSHTLCVFTVFAVASQTLSSSTRRILVSGRLLKGSSRGDAEEGGGSSSDALLLTRFSTFSSQQIWRWLRLTLRTHSRLRAFSPAHCRCLFPALLLHLTNPLAAPLTCWIPVGALF